MENRNNKWHIIVSVLVVGSLLLAVIGVTFAAFNYSKTGEKVNTITTGTIIMSYIEETNGINLTNAFPMTDDIGMTLDKENQYFDFTVSATITGDIDIAMDINRALKESNSKDLNEYAAKIVKRCEELGWQVNNRMNTGFKMIHIGLPIVGQKDQIAQVDIMTSTDMDFTRFKYFAPSITESKYKGAFRSMMIDCILKYATLAAAEDASDDEKQSYIAPDGRVYPYIRFQHLALSVDGLWKNVKTLKGKRGFLSNPKKDKEASKFLTSNPEEILNLLFGKNLFKVSDFNSFESIWNNVLFSEKFPYKDKIKDIIIGFIRYLNNNNSFQLEQNKLPLPQEIIDYCNENNININEVIKLKDED